MASLLTLFCSALRCGLVAMGGVLMLGATATAATLKLPELTALARTNSATVSAPANVAFTFAVSAGTSPTKSVTLTFRTPSGGIRTVTAEPPASGTATLVIAGDSQSGAYTLLTAGIFDAWDRGLYYQADGTVTTTHSDERSRLSSLAALPTRHAIDFKRIEFVVTGGSGAPTPPRLAAFARTSDATLVPGNLARYEYVLTRGTSAVTRMRVGFRLGGPNNFAPKFLTLENPQPSGTLEFTITPDLLNGAVAVDSVELEDSEGRLTTYERTQITDRNYAETSQTSRHSLALAGFTIANAAVGRFESPRVSISEGSGGTVAPGGTATFDYQVTIAQSPTARVEFLVQGPFEFARIVTANGAGGSFSVPVGPDWINGQYRIAAVLVLDVHGVRRSALQPTLRSFTVVNALAIAPVITNQPRSTERIVEGQTFVTGVNAIGSDPFSYQWYRGEPGDTSAPVPGATSSLLQLAAGDSATFWVRVTGNGGLSTDSATATVTVVKKPAITAQPANQSAPVGGSARFSVTVAGIGPFSYYWRFGFRGLGGPAYNQPSIEVSDLAADWAGPVWCEVTNSAGTTYSARAILNIRVSDTPLAVTAQPVDAVVSPGSAARFSAAAAGNPPLLYQWQKDGVDLVGATDASLVVTSISAAQLGGYALKITNGVETVVTRAAVLKFADVPHILREPLAAQTATAGTHTSFEVAAIGQGTLSYQWRKDGQAIAGATSNRLDLGPLAISDTGRYDVVIANALGASASRVVALTVISAPVPLRIDRAPASQSIASGQRLELAVGATGSSLRYQWLKDNLAIPGATGATLVIPAAVASDSGAYTVQVYGGAELKMTVPAEVTVIATGGAAPVFVRQPRAQTSAFLDEAVLLEAAVDGALPLSLRWHFKGAPLTPGDYRIVGADTARLWIGGFRASDAGEYALVATNSAGTTTSTPANVAMAEPADPARLINLSVRARVSADAGPLIVGFVVGGNVQTYDRVRLLIRGAGEALQRFGVSDGLADPLLTLYEDTRVAEVNDDWLPGVATTAAQVGAFPFAAASRDAALVVDSIGRPYTVHLRDARSATGTALAEIYEASPAGPRARTVPRLQNLSARTQVRAGEPLIAGFVIGGQGNKTILVRAVGPGLEQFGVGGVLADPRLELFDARAQSLAANGDWAGRAEATAAAAAVGAFALRNDSKDAVLIMTLGPGAYTAQVSGESGGHGVALVEVYELP